MLLLVGEGMMQFCATIDADPHGYLCEISICSGNSVLATSIAFVLMFSDTCEP